jgi:hypothetical protein
MNLNLSLQAPSNNASLILRTVSKLEKGGTTPHCIELVRQPDPASAAPPNLLFDRSNIKEPAGAALLHC